MTHPPAKRLDDMGLALDVRKVDDARAVLSLRGRLDAVSAIGLMQRIHELLAEGRTELVCDLTEVSVLDGSGLSALVSGSEVAREHGGFLKLAGVSAQGAKSFRLTGLDQVFELYPSVEAAFREAE